MKRMLPAFLGVLLAASGARADEVLLRMKLKPGEERRHRMTTRVSLELPGAGRALPLLQPIEVQATLVTRVISADPQGNASLEIATREVKVDPPEARSSEARKEMRCRATMTPRGRVTLSPSPDCEPFGPVAKLVQGFLAEVAMELPEKPIKPGATWKLPLERELPLGIPGFAGKAALRGDAVLTYRERKREGGHDCAMIVLTGAMNLDVSTGEGGLDVNASVEGESCFDLALGDWARSRATMKANLAIMTGQGSNFQARATTVSEQRRLADAPPKP
jgi:hypothetical protein